MEFKERYLLTLLSVTDTSRGTLWSVKEPVWIRNVRNYVDKGRKSHVGLSIRNRTCQFITDMVPMLLGTSKARGEGLIVMGCFKNSSKKGTFFRFRPYQIPFSDAYDENLGIMMKPNPPKPRLTKSERAELDKYLSHKGAAR